jgi:hypothetical protein
LNSTIALGIGEADFQQSGIRTGNFWKKAEALKLLKEVQAKYERHEALWEGCRWYLRGTRRQGPGLYLA